MSLRLGDQVYTTQFGTGEITKLYDNGYGIVKYNDNGLVFHSSEFLETAKQVAEQRTREAKGNAGPENLKAGDKVSLKVMGENQFVYGKIEKIDNNNALVRFDDGSGGWYLLSALREIADVMPGLPPERTLIGRLTALENKVFGAILNGDSWQQIFTKDLASLKTVVNEAIENGRKNRHEMWVEVDRIVADSKRAINNSISKANAVIDTVNQNQNALNNNFAKIEARLDSLETKGKPLARIAAQIATLAARVDNLVQGHDELEDEVNDLTEALAALKPEDDDPNETNGETEAVFLTPPTDSMTADQALVYCVGKVGDNLSVVDRNGVKHGVKWGIGLTGARIPTLWSDCNFPFVNTYAPYKVAR